MNNGVIGIGQSVLLTGSREAFALEDVAEMAASVSAENLNALHP